MNSDDQMLRRTFILEIGHALHTYGTPTHRLEGAVTRLADQLEIKVQVLATPTSMTVAFGPMHDQQVSLLRVEPGGGIDLGKLSDLDALVDATLRGELGLDQARSRLHALTQAPERFGLPWQLGAGVGASGSMALFFGGSSKEITLAAGLGLLVSLTVAWGKRREAWSMVVEPVAAAVTALLVVSMATWVSLGIELVLISSLVLLIPGFTLTLAIRELATRHLIAGSARMFGATLTFLELGFGVVLARKLAQVLPVVPTLPLNRPPPGWGLEALGLGVSALCFGVFFQSKPRDFGWVMLASTVAYGGVRLVGRPFGPELGAFVGALGMGLASNLFARHTGRPASLMLVPGTILLVPGAVGLRSMTAIVGKDVLTGVETGFAVLMIATAIVAGLLVSDVAAPSRRSL